MTAPWTGASAGARHGRQSTQGAGRTGGRWEDAAPLLLSASTAVALARLIGHPTETRVFVPIAVAIILADLVTAAALRRRLGAPMAALVGWVVAVLVLIGIVDPSLVNPASSGFAHGGVLTRQFRAAHAALANDGTPLPLLGGVVMAVAAIGAAAAALTRTLWARLGEGSPGTAGRGTVALCMAPSLAIFIYSTLVSAEHGRVATAAAYLLAALVFLGLSDRAGALAGTGGRTQGGLARGGGPAARGRPGGLAGALVGCVAVAVVVVAAGAGLSGMRLTVFHVTPHHAPGSGAQGAANGAPENLLTGIALVDNLLATEISASHTVIFRATSPLPTYWEVGTLSTFNGTQWLPSSGVDQALRASGDASAGDLGSAALPAPAVTQTFTASVHITDFVSRLLPAPPGTRGVSGVTATAIPEEGVLADTASGPGTDYVATAPVPAAVPVKGSQLSTGDPRLAPYLALPTQPAVVTELARLATVGATTPAAKAQALVDYFRSGRFRYTLSPPPTTGSDPLVQFLTETKAGFCQQFAGAYGVLARSLGIPTRLVVGFTAGQPGANGTYTVTGADAHVWPQVYLGPQAGWVSVEPTPPATPDAPNAAGILGTSSSPGARTTPTTTLTPQTAPAPSGASGATHAHHRLHPVSGNGPAWWVLVLAVSGGLVVLAAAATLLRRRRRVQWRSLPPDASVVHAWERATRAVNRRGPAPRGSGETPAEYVARLRHADPDGVMETSTDEAAALAALAALLERACYGPSSCTPDEAAEAQALAELVVAGPRRQSALAGSAAP